MQTDVLHRPTRKRAGHTGAFRGSAADTAPIAALFCPRSAERHVLPGGVIILHGTQANTLYQIVSGTVRCCTISEDGRRQIFSFAHRGDCLGFADLESWHYTAEAVDHVILKTVARERVESALETDINLQRAVRRLIALQLAERERHLVTLAYMSAEQRLLQFLEDFAARRNSDGFKVLPMTRQDIGDHLGLTLETVSRAFGALKRKGVIEMRGAERFRLAADPVGLAA